jgi:uncharacterized protein (TIGR00290 family)
MDDNILWRNGAVGKKFVASFSGGKDSTFALYKAMAVGEAIALITMMEENGVHSRSHRLTEKIVREQAASIGLPLFLDATSWDNYEKKFIRLLEETKAMGAEVLVAGDLDVPDKDCWHDMVTQKVGSGLALPLRAMGHREVVTEFVKAGFKSIIVTVNLYMGMEIDDLGKELSLEYIEALENRRIDSCGEAGEFHTIVVDGPIFKDRIDVKFGEVLRYEEYAFLDCSL